LKVNHSGERQPGKRWGICRGRRIPSLACTCKCLRYPWQSPRCIKTHKFKVHWRFTSSLRSPMQILMGQKSSHNLAKAQAISLDLTFSWTSVPLRHFCVTDAFECLYKRSIKGKHFIAVACTKARFSKHVKPNL
jgi:hypothetical protein